MLNICCKRILNKGFQRSLLSTLSFTSSVELSPLETQLQSSIKSFATDVIAPKVLKMDAEQKMDPTVIKGLFNQGLMGIEIEEKYGGAGMSFFDSCLVINELAKIDPSVSLIVDVQNTLIVTSFRKYGSQALKDKYLPRLAKDTVGAFCLSESLSGSDAFSLRTKAIKEGDFYRITGNKLWITNGDVAGVYIVFATIDPSLKHKGITAFVVDPAEHKGTKVGKKENKLGMKASATTEIILEDCLVPASNVLGEVGKGYKIAIELLNEGRIGIASQMVGLAYGVWNTIMPYLFQRNQFGTFIGDFQGMQHQYARAFTDLNAAELLYTTAARLRDQKKPFVLQAAMAKYFCSTFAQRIASEAIDWSGAIGFTNDFMLEKFYRDCKVGSIYEGTSNIQLNTIAKMVSQDYR